MKKPKSHCSNRSPRWQAVNRRQFLNSLGVAVLGSTELLRGAARGEDQSLPPRGQGSRREAPLRIKPGDVLYTDSQAAVLKFDPSTARTEVVSEGGLLERPYGIALLSNDDIVVSDTGCLAIVQIDAQNRQRFLPKNDALEVPFGIATDGRGNLYITNSRTLIRFDPVTGVQRTISEKQFFKTPVGVALAANGGIFVVDAAARMVLQVDSQSGMQTVVSAGQNLGHPVGISAFGDGLLVADSDVHGILHINIQTGHQTVVCANGYLVTPVSVAVADPDHIYVGDPDALEFAGGIIKINLRNCRQTPVVAGKDKFVNPRGLVVVPNKP